MGSRWQSFRGWADRLDRKAAATDWRPADLELAEEPVRSQIVAAAWPDRWGIPDAIVVADKDFVAREVANAQLPRSAPDVKELAFRGIVRYAFRASDGAEGVTADSFSQELEWRRTAHLWKRFKRAVAGVLRNV